jgi:dCMP deaminase
MDWDKYLMGFAKHAALKSKDSTKVGAALIRDRAVLCTGFNGAPRGVVDSADRYSREDGKKYRFVVHAEANCLMTAAREGIHVRGCALYTTHYPCSSCARLIVQSGIQEVVVGPGVTNMPLDEFEDAAVMFEEAAVVVYRFKED